MKSTINELTKESEFPCLKRHKVNGYIVLFFDEGNGVTVAKCNGWGNIGSGVDWSKSKQDDFELFYGSVTLVNSYENE